MNKYHQPIIRYGSLLLLLLVTAACSIANDEDRRTGSLEEPTPFPTAAAIAQTTYEVNQGQVVHELSFPGRIAPVVEQPLVFSQSGVVSQVHVRRNEEVAAGDLIADLDTTALEGELTLAQGALSITEAELESATEEIERARERAELRRDLAQIDLDYAVAQAGEFPTPEEQYQIDRLTILLELAELDLAELASALDPELAVAVEEARLRMAELENQIASAHLAAPFDGQISALDISEGYAVMAGEPVGSISAPTQIEVSASLRDDTMEELSEGMVVQIGVNNRPGEVLTGVIRQLPFPYGSGGEGAAGEGDDLALIQFDDLEQAIGLYERGDRVFVRVVVTQREDVLWLPPQAIRDFNGRKFVVIQEGDVQQRIDVTLGIVSEERVEITSGLEEGQVVVGQ
jgi:multidrug efflux pump subunit AcrA (membrane-fusion protein)